MGAILVVTVELVGVPSLLVGEPLLLVARRSKVASQLWAVLLMPLPVAGAITESGLKKPIEEPGIRGLLLARRPSVDVEKLPNSSSSRLNHLPPYRVYPFVERRHRTAITLSPFWAGSAVNQEETQAVPWLRVNRGVLSIILLA